MSTQTSQRGASGVIHNIGYRRYEGARLGRFDTGKTLFLQTLRGSFGLDRGAKAKLFPAILLGCTLIPAFIIIAIETQAKQIIVDFNVYTVTVQVIPALFLAIQAPQALSRDLRFGTLSLYFSRPVSARDYVTAKLAGMWSGLMIFLLLPVALLYVGALLIKQPFGEMTVKFVSTIFVLALLALLLASLSALIASVTPRRGLGVAAIITVLIGSYAVTTMVQAIIYIQSAKAAMWSAVISPITMYDTAYAGIFNTTTNGFATEPGPLVGTMFALIMLAISALCYWLLNVRYRKLASS